MMIMLLRNVHCYTNSNLLIIFLNISFGLVLRYGCYNCYVNSGRIYNKKACIILRCHAPWKILWFRDFSCVTIYGSRDLFSNVTDSIIAKHFTHHEEFNYRGSCRKNYRGSCRKNLIIEGHPRLLLNNHEWIERAINQLQNNFFMPVSLGMFLHGVQVLLPLDESKLQRKLHIYRCFGWSYSDISLMGKNFLTSWLHDRLRYGIHWNFSWMNCGMNLIIWILVHCF